MASQKSKPVRRPSEGDDEERLIGLQYLRAHLEKAKAAKKSRPEVNEDDAEESEAGDCDFASAELTAAIRKAGWPYEGRVLILDLETTADTRQVLRFGSYELRGLPKAERVRRFKKFERKGETKQARVQFRDALDRVDRRGVFYNADPSVVSATEQTLIKRYASRMDFDCWDAGSFVRKVLLNLAAEDELLIIGHNLPFDLSRLPTWWTEAADEYRGGFSFRLCDCPGNADDFCGFHPALRIKKIGRNKHLMGFTATSNPETGGKKSYAHVHFLDTSTLGRALLGPGELSLGALGARARAKTIKRPWDEPHGEPVTIRYLSYNRKDVKHTWSLFTALREFYASHGVSRPIWQIYSEASLGKAYLKDLGFEPFLEKHPAFPKDVIAAAMEAYYGGRTEVKIRLKPAEVILTDFRSQYPAGNALMGLQDLLLADEIEVRRSPDLVSELESFLRSVSVEDMLKKEAWKNLKAYVRIKPDMDLLPIRAKYQGESKPTNVGLCPVVAGPTWYTLADVIASKILTGKAPQIIDAIALEPKRFLTKKAWDFFRDEYDLEPNPLNRIEAEQDFFARVIDIRSAIKARRPNDKTHPDYAPIDAQQSALKLLANATSYGVLVEYLVEEWKTKRKNHVYAAGKTQVTRHRKTETPGRYFAGPVGSLIPATGRLLLAIAQTLAAKEGRQIPYAFCDTDSLCFAKPAHLSREEFQAHVESICGELQNLSPFSDGEPFLKIEDENYERKKKTPKPLYCVAVSAKRYAIYNIIDGADTGLGRYDIRKFSAHGMPDITEPKDYQPVPPDPADSDWKRDGCRRYQYDLWRAAIDALERGNDPVEIEIALPSLDEPQLQQVTVATPNTLDQVLAIRDVRPFSFFTALPALQKAKFIDLQHGPERDELMELTKSRFYTASSRSFSECGNIFRLIESTKSDASDPQQPVSKRLPFTTINERLAGYFQHPESTAWPSGKDGPLGRRTVLVTYPVYIGKESHQLHDEEEEQSDGLLAEEKDLVYAKGDVRAVIKRYGVAAFEKVTDVPRPTLEKLAGGSKPKPGTLKKITKAAALLAGKPPQLSKREQLEKRQSKLRERLGELWDDVFEDALRNGGISGGPSSLWQPPWLRRNQPAKARTNRRPRAEAAALAKRRREERKLTQKILKEQDAAFDRIDLGALDALNRVVRKWLELHGELLTKDSIKKRRAKIERFRDGRALDITATKTLSKAIHEVMLEDQKRHDAMSAHFAGQIVQYSISKEPILVEGDWRRQNEAFAKETGFEITGYAWSSEIPTEEEIRQLTALSPEIAFEMQKVRSARLAAPPPELQPPMEHPMAAGLDRSRPPYVGRYRVKQRKKEHEANALRRMNKPKR